jgi:hypothetical protein
MNVWKKTLPPILFGVAVVAFLFAALEERVIDGGPIRYTWLVFAFTFFAIAVLFFVVGRKSGGGSGPPSA